MTTMIDREESQKMIQESELGLEVLDSPYSSYRQAVPWAELIINYAWYPLTLRLLLERFKPDLADLRDLETEMLRLEKRIQGWHSRAVDLVRNESLPLLCEYLACHVKKPSVRLTDVPLPVIRMLLDQGSSTTEIRIWWVSPTLYLFNDETHAAETPLAVWERGDYEAVYVAAKYPPVFSNTYVCQSVS